MTPVSLFAAICFWNLAEPIKDNAKSKSAAQQGGAFSAIFVCNGGDILNNVYRSAFSAISCFMSSTCCSMDFTPPRASLRARTDTVPSATSLSPTTSI